MAGFPPYALVSHVSRAQACAALAAHATRVWEQPYEQPWQRDYATWDAIGPALCAAAESTSTQGAARKPPGWLAPLVRRRLDELAAHWAMDGSFRDIRTLERLGLITLEINETYVLAMISGLGDRWNTRPRSAELSADPELIERALWWVFEVEGGGEVSLANMDKYGPANSWQNAFLALIADGTLDRDRVLDACLAALRRDFSAYRSGWFRGLHEALAPTQAEQAGRQETYLALLASEIPATATLATRPLAALDKAGVLDDDAFLERCTPGLSGRPKATVIPLIRILEHISVRRDDRGADIAQSVAWALENDHPDVQTKALRLLRKLNAGDLVRDRLEALCPAARKEAAEWIGAAVPTDPVAQRSSTAVVSAAPPVVGVTDLQHRLAAVLEDPSDPYELELVLAALVTVDDQAGLLEPLQRRARQIHGREQRNQTRSLREHLAALVMHLGVGSDGPMPEPQPSYTFLAGRLAEIAAQPRGVLLATPTEPGGWIDPATLVDRGRSPATRHRPLDAVAALLRLRAQGREHALIPALQLPGEFGAALRYALGGPGGHVATPELWVAAARARAPLATEDEHLFSVGLRLPHSIDPAPPTAASPPGYKGGMEGREWICWAATIWPADAEPFFAHGLPKVMAASFGTEVEHDATRILAALLAHPGRLADFAALTLTAGLNAHAAEQAAIATEAFIVLASSGRLSPDILADSLAHTVDFATPTRWARRLAEAANGGAAVSVRQTLTRLLPRLAPELRGMHALLRVLYDQILRTGAALTDPQLRDWLAQFTGGSTAARVARLLLDSRD